MSNFKIKIMDGFSVTRGDLNWRGLDKLGDVEIFDRTSKDDTVARAFDADAVFTNKVLFSRKEIADLPNLKYIGVLATGYNNVDLKAAATRGICVTNIPSYGTESVAQSVFAHILNIANSVEDHSHSVCAGDWSKSVDFSYSIVPLVELYGKILGIVGYGAIGRRVAQIGAAFGMKILAYSPSRKIGTCDASSAFTSVDDIFATADIISLNCPLNESTREIICARNISKMRSGVWIINTGRGGLTNERELADALADGRVGAAGLDVLSSEPPSENNPLIGARNCHITPHIAWMTCEARARLIDIAIANLAAWKSGSPANVV